MIYSAVFSLIVGLGMIIQWVMSFVQDQIPELKTEPIRIWFHISGEMITALALIASALGLFLNRSWAEPLNLISTGMLLYTAIVSPGYFAQRDQWRWTIMFGLLIVMALISIFFLVG